MKASVGVLLPSEVHVSLYKHHETNDHESEHVELVRKILEAFNHAGDYTLDVHKQVTWKAANKVIQFMRTVEDHTIELKLKPGDNSSCWLARLTVPNGVSAVTIGKEIESLSDWNGRSPIGRFAAVARPVDPTLPITEKLQRLRATAAKYMESRQRIIELRKSAEEHLQKAEQAEADATELEEQLASDHTGRGAYEALQAVHNLLNVEA